MARILEKRRLPQQGCVPADLQTGKRNFICRICQSRDSGIRAGRRKEISFWQLDTQTGRCPRCAVRFAYIPGIRPEEIVVKAIHQFVDIPVRASFSCDDDLISRIWKVAEHTFMLCSGVFFIDGIKRDKWIWSGDAYQSLFVNRYLTADVEIERRTLLALRGNENMTTHINTIIDYTLYWIQGVWAHYESCGDLDKEGPLCAEQMLYLRCLDVMAQMSSLCGYAEAERRYREQYESLRIQVDRFFWDEEKHAYIDSFISGRRHVTRHANIFTVLFDIADETRKREIAEHVLLNEEVPKDAQN